MPQRIKISLVLLTSSFAFLAHAQTGMLVGTGSVYVNGSQLTNSLTVMPGDVVQTREGGVANLNTLGSSAVIDSNSVIRVQGAGLALDRGSVSIATGKGMSVFARDLKISPVTANWTQFYVTRASGVIQIIARKENIIVSCGSSSSTVKEGQEISRADAADCGIVEKPGGAPSAAKGPVLSSPTAERAGTAAAGALLGWVLLHNDDPVSPFQKHVLTIFRSWSIYTAVPSGMESTL